MTYMRCLACLTKSNSIINRKSGFALRGQGVASELVKLAADKILADGNEIGATCSYALAWFQRHPEYPVVYSGPAVCRIDRR